MGDGMIDVVIRHGGRMDFSGSEPKYVGGEENIVGFDTNYLSYRTIMAVVRDDLGYQIVHRIWWLPPKKTMANGLRELFGDNEILYGLMIDVNKVEDGQVVMFFEATKEVSGGWDNEDGNLGDDEGMNSDDDDGAENSVRPSHSPFVVISDEYDNSAQGDLDRGRKRNIRIVYYSSGGEEIQQCSSSRVSVDDSGTDKKAHDDFIKQEPVQPPKLIGRPRRHPVVPPQPVQPNAQGLLPSWLWHYFMKASKGLISSVSSSMSTSPSLRGEVDASVGSSVMP
ncbi:hypothetical protein LINPERPRIM_LOCUS656 [Linum perenne]